jgi:hypothetical protein
MDEGKVESMRALLGRMTPPGARANLRFHAHVGTGVCVGDDAGFWFRGGKACPTILASTRDVPEGEAEGREWRQTTDRAPWPELLGLLRSMTEDEVREAMARS